ncbi:ATP-binding cassette domain-containing protein, partial [Streptococcus pyogenes]
ALDKEEHQSSIKTAKDYSITMKNVDFAYDDTEKVLNNVSLTVKSGQHLAIVGPSGAGKTTIFSLLMKFHQGYQGQLHIGN